MSVKSVCRHCRQLSVTHIPETRKEKPRKAEVKKSTHCPQHSCSIRINRILAHAWG